MSRAGQRAEPFVLGGRLWPSRRVSPGVLSVALVWFVVALPLRGLYRATGSSMEEGFMLLFPRLVSDGKVANVDFLHLYGPGSLDVLAAWYRIFGDTLESQRTFGLLQHLGIIFGIYALTRAWGYLIATIAALTATLLILTPIGLSALAWHGAVAFGLWAVVMAVRARHVEPGHALRCWFVAGALAGLALSFRPDLVVALTLALGWLIWTYDRGSIGGSPRPLLISLAAGLGVGLLSTIVHLFRAGPGAMIEGMLLDPVIRLRPGRELPGPPSWDRIDGALQAVAEGVPPWWGLPSLPARLQLFFWFFAVIIVAVTVPAVAWTWRRHDRARHATEQSGPSSPWREIRRHDVLLAGGLFGLGILPQALQRPDSTHLAWVAVVSWPLLVVVLAGTVARRWPTIRPRSATWLAATAMAVLMLVVAPFYTYRHYILHVRVAAQQLPLPYLVERGERRFWFGDGRVASAANQALADLEELAEPGDRLLVGPADLRRTIYSDVAFYWMFPELEPATYYIEMDPGLADQPGSRLADDLKTADFVLLTNFWTGWYEPNASSEYGSDVPNQIVANHFCLVGAYEDYLVLLYQRCAEGSGISPADLGDRPVPEGGGPPP